MRLRGTTTLFAMMLLGLASALPGQAPGPPGTPNGSAAANGPAANGPVGNGPFGNGPFGNGPPRFMMPSFALQEALDVNHDGKLSGEEIRTAAESLKKLDKDHDGKLSAEEIGWPPRFAGFGPGGGGPGGGGPGGGGPGGPFGDRGQSGRGFAERLMDRDANQDGKVAPAELPTSMRWLIPLGDHDKDGAVDEKESRALAERIGAGADDRNSR